MLHGILTVKLSISFLRRPGYPINFRIVCPHSLHSVQLDLEQFFGNFHGGVPLRWYTYTIPESLDISDNIASGRFHFHVSCNWRNSGDSHVVFLFTVSGWLIPSFSHFEFEILAHFKHIFMSMGISILLDPEII